MSDTPSGARRTPRDRAELDQVLGSAAPTEPVHFSTKRVLLAGTAAWAVALVAVLLVPSWHSGPRAYWPWTCVAGIAIGVVSYLYVRRGRGNAVEAD